MRLLLINLFLILIITGYGQKTEYTGFPSLVWPKLYDIKYQTKQDDLGNYEKPLFSDVVKALNGKTVTLPGYMVPFESGLKGNHFILTSLPLNACFFCGVGGPETVIEVYLASAISYTENPIEVRGILQLNDADPDQLIYRLTQAEFLGVIE
jgi:hypothetical protein